jgi:DNA-binding beta-propeller fold protein YncE/mono/diheme cytochrome c family protein
MVIKQHTNKKNIRIFLFLIFTGFNSFILSAKAGEECLSPFALVADNEDKNLYVAEATAKQVAVFNIDEGKVTKVISLPEQPTGLALAPDGRLVYVTAGGPEGKVYIIDLKSGKIQDTLPAGHTPVAPVISSDGKVLYICNKFNNNISIYDLTTKSEPAKAAVTREPIAAALTPDNKFLFVANHLPAGAADGDYTAAVVSVLDTTTQTVIKTIDLPNGSTSLQCICISPNGQYAYVTHILSRYQLPTTQLDRGWMNTNALSIIDISKKELLNTVLLDDVDLGAANPWGVAFTDDGKYICINHAGTHEVSVIDATSLHKKLASVAKGEKVSDVSRTPEDVPNDLSFLVGLRRRLKLTGNGPRGLAVIGTKAYSAEYFTGSLGVVDINPESYPKARSIALGTEKSPTKIRKGQMLFNDATLCFQHWQSCASCHPGGGRVDALNWDLLNDGIGNPKNTKSLLLAHKTPPAMMTGVRPDAESAVRAGIMHIQFAVRPEEDAAAIDEYLKSLEPVQSPFLVNDKLSKAAEQGRGVFNKSGCASCHTPPLYTDLQKYNIGTGKGLDENQSFDTPTLIEVWRTAPYLYNGRAKTIKEVMTKYNADDKHGKTSNLTDEEIYNLAEFVLSL